MYSIGVVLYILKNNFCCYPSTESQPRKHVNCRKKKSNLYCHFIFQKFTSYLSLRVHHNSHLPLAVAPRHVANSMSWLEQTNHKTLTSIYLRSKSHHRESEIIHRPCTLRQRRGRSVDARNRNAASLAPRPTPAHAAATGSGVR